MDKLVHISLCGPVTDGFTYQDNILPKFHKKLGYDVSVITSKYIYNSDGKIEKDDRNIYVNEHGIKTIRLRNKYNTNITSKFKKYENLLETIRRENPDILFIHGLQFLDLKSIKKLKKNDPNIKVYIDNHADYSNSATNWFSKNILHKIIWRYHAKMIEPYTTKFFGVLPSRVDFLINVYNLPPQKIKLLVMGADDDEIKRIKSLNSRDFIRKKHNITDDDFLIVTGGKIDKAKKQTLLLMEAVKYINNENLKVIVFGSVISELKDQLNELVDGNKIQYVGWIRPEDSYKYFDASNLVVFPGRHSVFWEQSAGQGVPLLVKWWPGTSHININGNVEFLFDDTKKEIVSKLENIIYNKGIYNFMSNNAYEAKNNFLYSKIARESLEIF